jgi:hypothetical protein
MTDEPRKISKSLGLTRTEQFLSKLCDRTFLKLWSYPNPFRGPGKELCDLLAVFENHVFLFFDRENKTFEGDSEDIALAWERWKKEAIDKQIKTAKKARNYVLKNRDEIYLDAKCCIKFPVKLPADDMVIHTIIVAHGASEACKAFSAANVSGSLAIAYGGPDTGFSIPFMVNLERTDPVHIFDSHNVSIILAELDTFCDFTDYLAAKEAAISQFELIGYCGEEDLLANYFFNFDKTKKKHFIGTLDKSINALMIEEGGWQTFIGSEPYKRKKQADQSSYLWDDLLQRTTQNALDGTLLGDGGIFNSRSAIFEMAKEPRFMRRTLADAMRKAIEGFPDDCDGGVRNLSFMPSFNKSTGHVFLQVKHPNAADDDSQHRLHRAEMLKIACGVAKNKFSHLTKIVGIAIYAPKFAEMNSEDFVLLDCAEWSNESREFYEERNKQYQFFETSALKQELKTVSNFPRPEKSARRIRIGRNQLCPCGSNKKFKKCHGA